ncbi:SRPBCC family protein [Paenibacillus methanolicus]|uniref:Activator of Hsp90 ATPase-like protein n=1 Tax=Paenibacillus methanolicus TaxID=582686 RepID=A0A5S5C408_9BACL|nr:SRPBCC domain-containing protein [Paenibacillus methanolicus]TYP74047.1 activator of Hsp90 ATPase-like protein [Paenibacillus methanolicus]
MGNDRSREGVIGLTAATGYQIGVRRTLPWSQEQAWAFLTSSEGLRLWIGEVETPRFQVGETFETAGGVSGEFRVVKSREQLRLRWKRAAWPSPSTLQIRLLPAKTGTTVSFHQEQLASAALREEMKQLWEDAIAAMMAKASQRT